MMKNVQTAGDMGKAVKAFLHTFFYFANLFKWLKYDHLPLPRMITITERSIKMYQET